MFLAALAGHGQNYEVRSLMSGSCVPSVGRKLGWVPGAGVLYVGSQGS